MADAGKVLQTEKREQSLVTENFMRVVGTHSQVIPPRYKKKHEYAVLSIFGQ